MAQGSLRASVENKLCARSFLCCSMPIDSDDDVYVAQADMTERKAAYLGVLRAEQLETLAKDLGRTEGMVVAEEDAGGGQACERMG